MSQERFSVLPGQRFGRLVVREEFLRPLDSGRPRWCARCICDCGQAVEVLLQNLKGRTRSCGCLKKKGTMSKKFRETRGAPRRIQVRPGQRFERLTFIRETSEVGSQDVTVRRAHCICVCGTLVKTWVHNLTNGIARSCGCLQREQAMRIGKNQATHGLTRHPHYARWCNIRARCADPNNSHYEYYGARGIRLWSEWYDVTTFVAYLESALGPCPPGHSLDRIDNDGNYEPGNLRWADPITQRHNQRRGTSWKSTKPHAD